MKFRMTMLALTMLLLRGTSYPQQNEHETNGVSSVQAFLGRWDLTLHAPDRDYGSWLELSDDNGQLKARMVGRWGHARMLPKVEVSGEKLTFVSPKESEGRKDDMVFEAKLLGSRLVGSTTGPDGTPWPWIGERAPSLKRTGASEWGKPIRLFNGRDLTGWRPDKENPMAAWRVEDGTLISPGNGPELITTQQFRDFKLHVEFNIGKGANSGVYLRGRYEVQVEDNSIQAPPSHHTGAIYGFIAPSPEMPRKPGEWQSFDVTLVGRTVSVAQNGTTIIDQQEIPGVTGGALDSRESQPGPIYLQGSEDGHVAYRNIVLTPPKK